MSFFVFLWSKPSSVEWTIQIWGLKFAVPAKTTKNPGSTRSTNKILFTKEDQKIRGKE